MISESDGIVFIRLREGRVARTVQRDPDINVDLDADGKPLSIEVIGSTQTSAAALLAVVKEFGIEIVASPDTVDKVRLSDGTWAMRAPGAREGDEEG